MISVDVGQRSNVTRWAELIASGVKSILIIYNNQTERMK